MCVCVDTLAITSGKELVGHCPFLGLATHAACNMRVTFARSQANKKYGGKIPGVKGENHLSFKTNYTAKLGEVKRDLLQADAKQYLPPRASIWRDNNRGAWSVHLAPHRRHSESFKNHGADSTEAMKSALRFVWRQWLNDHCLPLEHCPVSDLFPG